MPKERYQNTGDKSSKKKKKKKKILVIIETLMISRGENV